MVYRGPYKVRVQEKDIPGIEHPDDAIVRVTTAAISGSDVHARLGKKGTDVVHQSLDPVVVVGPRVVAVAGAVPGARKLVRAVVS